MAQKKNKDRKQQLLNFKQKTKKKMDENQVINELQGIKTYPVWASQEKLDITGLEFEAMYNAINIFREGLVAAESVMQRGLEQGKITMKYVDAEGKDVAPEKVKDYSEKMQAILKARQAEQEKGNTPAPTSPILTETGEKQAPSVETVNPLKAV